MIKPIKLFHSIFYKKQTYFLLFFISLEIFDIIFELWFNDNYGNNIKLIIIQCPSMRWSCWQNAQRPHILLPFLRTFPGEFGRKEE